LFLFDIHNMMSTMYENTIESEPDLMAKMSAADGNDHSFSLKMCGWTSPNF
ncbi:hypothetical protein CEXT_303041, partial [Caerostris extrusa]